MNHSSIRKINLCVLMAVIAFLLALPSSASTVSLLGTWQGEDTSDVSWGTTALWLVQFNRDGTFDLRIRYYTFTTAETTVHEKGTWHFNQSTRRLTTQTKKVGGKDVDSNDPYFNDTYEVTRISATELRFLRVEYDPRYRWGLNSYKMVSVPATQTLPEQASAYSGGRWTFWVGILCLASNRDYEKTPLGKDMMNASGVRALIETYTKDTTKNQCFHSQNWISGDFCQELLNTDAKTDNGIFVVMEKKYKGEILGLEKFNVCRVPN